MTIKCYCSDRLDKSNTEYLLKIVDEMIKENETSPLRFREPETIDAARHFWTNAKNMLETIKKLPDCQ